MPRPILPLAALLALVAASGLPAAAHRHGPPAIAPAAPAARFAADATLRAAMDRVRNAVEAFEHARHGHMGPAQVRALSEHLDAQVMHVFAECRLEPQADASLHVVLGVVLEGSRAMRASPGDFAPVAAMERAMADYARLFDDPGVRDAREASR